MARKSGGFNKVLELIGLVDDDDPRDTYEDEYQSGNYGRQDAYAPQRNAARAPRQNNNIAPRRQSSYEPTRAPRMTRSTYEGRFDSRGSAPDRRAAQPQRRSAFVERVEDPRANRYDYSPRPQAASRFGSLDDAPAANNLPQTRNPGRGGARQRTVMYTVNALEDCCDIIDNLLNNNTVIITMDALDPKLMQRVVDTLSGAVFALHATIRKASDHTYLIAPTTVEVNDDTYNKADRIY